ncbi:MAG TPA: hypothetical protein VGJ26_19415 [Pirellulales bacterium]
MKLFAIALLVLCATYCGNAGTAHALWPNRAPVDKATYGWRPWWGGLHGWEPYYGSRAYPAYKGQSPYRLDCWGSPPTSELDTLPFNQGGQVPYPRSFVYPWKGKTPQPPGVNSDVENTTAP